MKVELDKGNSRDAMKIVEEVNKTSEKFCIMAKSRRYRQRNAAALKDWHGTRK
jgi:hypothetical protein